MIENSEFDNNETGFATRSGTWHRGRRLSVAAHAHHHQRFGITFHETVLVKRRRGSFGFTNAYRAC